MMTLDEAVKKVRPLDEKAMEGARKRWDSIAKPPAFSGRAGEYADTDRRYHRYSLQVTCGEKAVVAMCADNGVVEEGVTQTDRK